MKTCEVSGKSVLYKCLWLLLLIILPVSQSFLWHGLTTGLVCRRSITAVSFFLLPWVILSQKAPVSTTTFQPPLLHNMVSSHYNSSSPPRALIEAGSIFSWWVSRKTCVSFSKYLALQLWNLVQPFGILFDFYLVHFCSYILLLKTSEVYWQDVQQILCPIKMDFFGSHEKSFCLLRLLNSSFLSDERT